MTELTSEQIELMKKFETFSKESIMSVDKTLDVPGVRKHLRSAIIAQYPDAIIYLRKGRGNNSDITYIRVVSDKWKAKYSYGRIEELNNLVSDLVDTICILEPVTHTMWNLRRY